MIRRLPPSEGATLGFEVDGKVSLEEERQWLETIEAAIARHGKLRILVVLHESAKWGVEAGVEDLKWVVTHMRDIDRIAIVSSSKVWKWLVTIDGLFAQLVGIGEKHFETSRIDDAWQWLKQ